KRGFVLLLVDVQVGVCKAVDGLGYAVKGLSFLADRLHWKIADHLLPPRRGYLRCVLPYPTPPEPRPPRQPVPACPAPYAWLGAPQSSVCAWRICCMVGFLPFLIP